MVVTKPPTIATTVASALDEVATTAKDTLDAAQVPYHPSGKKPKGSVFQRIMLMSPEFVASLARALEDAGIRAEDLRRIGVTDEAHLRRVLLDAYDLLDKRSVTVDDWLGRVFELLGPDIPDVHRVVEWAAAIFRDAANERIRSGASGFTFVNGYYEMAGVTAPFGRVVVARNLSIRLRGQETGSSWVDRAVLIFNADGQCLIISLEFKTEGAKGGLKGQIGKRDERVFGAFFEEGKVDVSALDPVDLEGAKITFQVVDPRHPGGAAPGVDTLDFENLILPRDAADPAVPHGSDLYGRVGVHATRTAFRVAPAEDSRGRPYLRVAAPVDTYGIRDVLQRLLRDRSWQ